MRHIIKKTSLPLLTAMWAFSIVGCRDFRDYRTPYKSFVTIAFHRKQKDSQPIVIRNKVTDEILNPPLKKLPPATDKPIYNIPLDSSVDHMELEINDPSANSPKTLTIHYRKKAVLISHQCGCAYKYTLDKVAYTLDDKCKITNKELSTFNESYIDLQIYL